jgi:hypothetical protein
MTPDQPHQPRRPPEFIPRRRNPVSNAERQRQFRERNPGYYGRLKAKERAATKARVEKKIAIEAILYAYRTMPLMLPAPVEALEIRGMTTILRRDETPAFAMAELRQRRAA